VRHEHADPVRNALPRARQRGSPGQAERPLLVPELGLPGRAVHADPQHCHLLVLQVRGATDRRQEVGGAAAFAAIALPRTAVEAQLVVSSHHDLVGVWQGAEPLGKIQHLRPPARHREVPGVQQDVPRRHVARQPSMAPVRVGNANEADRPGLFGWQGGVIGPEDAVARQHELRVRDQLPNHIGVVVGRKGRPRLGAAQALPLLQPLAEALTICL